jgi:hypothetical protein
MPVPSSITDLSRIPSDNSPQGTEAARGTIDDYFRAHAAFIRQVSDLVGGPTVVLPSAAMVNIGFSSSSNVLITGTTAITSFDNVPDGVVRWVTFNGALALVHSNALQLPGLANISTAAGDAAMFKSLGGGNWKCLSFMPVLIRYPASGLLLSDASPVSIAQGGTASINVAGARANLGLGNVSNTSDADKPVSTAQNAAIAGKVSKAGDVMTGSLDFNNNVGLYSRDAGNVLRQLLLLANDNNVYFTNGGGGSINYMSRGGSKIAGLTDAGAFTATSVTETSDERKKRAWQRVPHDLIERLAGIRKSGLFIWKRGGARGLGVGAQSLEQILPDAVHTDERGAKSVQYGAASMVVVVELARAVVDLRARLVELEAR